VEVTNRIPHLLVVVAVTFFVLIGFAAVSAYALILTDDNTTKGNVIGTWINFAMLGVGFWLGSSSGGKAKDESPAGTPADPVNVKDAE
jgi:predicted MFS family arabinose efflux permease